MTIITVQGSAHYDKYYRGHVFRLNGLRALFLHYTCIGNCIHNTVLIKNSQFDYI